MFYTGWFGMLRYSAGEMPALRLKNLPKEDWSEKLSIEDISFIDNLELLSRDLDSL